MVSGGEIAKPEDGEEDALMHQEEEEAFGFKIRQMIEEDLKMNQDQRKALLDHFVGSNAKVSQI